MNIDVTSPKTWQERGGGTALLTALRREVEALPPDVVAEALPRVLAFLSLQRRGVGYLFDALDKITRYNEAAHAQQSKQSDAVRALVDAFKEQDRTVRKLTKRVDSLEKQVTKLTAKVAEKRPKTR